MNQMDVEEWELIPDEGYLEIHDDGGSKIYSRKYPKHGSSNVFQMNYFICPQLPNPPQFVETTNGHLRELPNQVLKAMNQEFKITSPAVSEKITGEDQDPVSQVFFKKMKETEFVDMKVESPRSSTSRGFMNQIEGAGAFQFEENGDPSQEAKVDSEVGDEGWLNIWKWSLTGIGAICSFGAAAATVCIIVLSSHNKNKQPRINQKLQFQIYTNDKRIKQVVHHAHRLNEAISAVRGVPITRAHITFGGYYDAPL